MGLLPPKAMLFPGGSSTGQPVMPGPKYQHVFLSPSCRASPPALHLTVKNKDEEVTSKGRRKRNCSIPHDLLTKLGGYAINTKALSPSLILAGD